MRFNLYDTVINDGRTQRELYHVKEEYPAQVQESSHRTFYPNKYDHFLERKKNKLIS